MANTYTLISSVTVSSGSAASITFTSIPATYTDLLLRVSARTTNANGPENMTMSINGSTANQSGKYLYGNGSSATSGSITNWDVAIQGTVTTSNTFAVTDIYIPNYAGSNNKSASQEYATENNGTAASLVMEALLWSQSAAITSLSMAFGNIAQYSTAYLYGISNA
jgi:hypothetical protein